MIGFFFQFVLSIELSAWISVVKNLPAMQETQVRSLSREDPLAKLMMKLKLLLIIDVQVRSTRFPCTRPGEAGCWQCPQSWGGLHARQGCRRAQRGPAAIGGHPGMSSPLGFHTNV